MRHLILLKHVLLFILLFGICHTYAADITTTWDGTSGNWSDPNKWDNGVPNNNGTTYDVVINGGEVTVDTSVTIEEYLQDEGTVTISGSDKSLILTGSLELAPDGTSELNIQDGAQVAASTIANIANLGDATVSITSGGSLDIATETSFVIGGGQVSGSDGSGTINVDGPGSSWTVGQGFNTTIRLGDGGAGYLNITNGGQVSLDHLQVSGFVGSFFVDFGKGEVLVDGEGSLLTTDWIGVGTRWYSGVGSVNGDLVVSNGGRVEAEYFSFKDGGRVYLDDGYISGNNDDEFFINGILTGRGVIESPTAPIINSDLISPGNSLANVHSDIGSINVIGDYQQLDDGTLRVDLGGVVPESSYDLLSISGSAELDGILRVDLFDDGSGEFQPQAGNSFTILSAPLGIDGTFSQMFLPTLSSDQGWAIYYGASTFTLAVADTTLEGDFDGNGIVDADDLTQWHTQYGMSNSSMSADSNDNGTVDGFDFLAWQRNFGNTLPLSAAASTTVPEPSSFLMVAVICATLTVRTRRVLPENPHVFYLH